MSLNTFASKLVTTAITTAITPHASSAIITPTHASSATGVSFARDMFYIESGIRKHVGFINKIN